jgi:hypothetical protein
VFNNFSGGVVLGDEPECVIASYDVYHYVVVKKVLDSIFNILQVFICQWEIQTYWVNTFPTRWQWVYVADVNELYVYSIMKLY